MIYNNINFLIIGSYTYNISILYPLTDCQHSPTIFSVSPPKPQPPIQYNFNSVDQFTGSVVYDNLLSLLFLYIPHILSFTDLFMFTLFLLVIKLLESKY